MLKYLYFDYPQNALICVYSNHQNIFPKQNAKKYLDTLCQKEGSSFQARKEYYQKKMNIHKLVPIVINRQEIYFPLSNIKNYDCIWIHYFSIQKVIYKKKECIITFFDDTSLVVKNSMRIQHTMRSIQRFLYTKN
ncbi:MAG: competence protein ComK [Bacillota bacterium]|nr:competence protein ComK [Bacillota bacterium]